MLQRFLPLWLTALCGVAWLWPQSPLAEYDPFAATAPQLKYLIGVTMFAIGCLLEREEVRNVLRRWPVVLGGTTAQYLVMPTAAWLTGRLFGLEGDLLLGVLMVGCVPGAMASNVLTLTARGNVSYSVSLTTAATMLSPVVVPGVLYLATRETDIDRVRLARDAFVTLVTQVAGPVIAGHLLARNIRRLSEVMQWLGPLVANFSILWIIAVIVNAHHASIASATGRLWPALLLINLVGYSAGWLAGSWMRLTDGMRKALVLEIGLQNAGLGSVLAKELLPGRSEAALPPVLYMFGCMLTGTLLAHWLGRRTPSEAVPLTGTAGDSRTEDISPGESAAGTPAAGESVSG